jgi:hypothetical protein
MTVTAYRVGTSNKGRVQIEAVGEFDLHSWVINATTKPVKGGGFQVYDAQITAVEPLPDNAVIEFESKWYQVQTPQKGMLGMYRHYLIQTARPS